MVTPSWAIWKDFFHGARKISQSIHLPLNGVTFVAAETQRPGGVM